METCPAEILLLRPPAPGHGHTQAGPRARAAPPGARPGLEGIPRASPCISGPQADEIMVAKNAAGMRHSIRYRPDFFGAKLIIK
jgi:hypothetical protein